MSWLTDKVARRIALDLRVKAFREDRADLCECLEPMMVYLGAQDAIAGGWSDTEVPDISARFACDLVWMDTVGPVGWVRAQRRA